MKKLLTLLSAAATLPFGAAAFAQDAEVAEAEPTPVVSFSGFVDTSMFVPMSGYEPGDRAVVFGLDQVEVDVTAVPSAGLTIQSDLQFFPGVPFETDESGAVNVADTIIEQGYIDYEGGSGAFVRVGKANAPIGAESIDAPDLYQYSWGQLFTSATPSNLTGIFGGYRSDSISAQVWVTNDWDLPGTPESATPGLRLEYAFDAGHVGLASTYGPVVADDPYAMIDIDTAISAGDLTVLGEFNFGTGDSLDSLGFLVTLNYAFADWVSATLRGDYLTQTATADGVETETSNASVTAAGLFTLTDNFGSVVEIRADIPDEGDTTVYGAVELLAWW